MAGALALVQIASDAIYSQSATPHSIPALLPAALGERIYSTIVQAAPAPYANAMLAYAAMQRGDLPDAQRFAQALPPSVRRDDLLGRIAAARGDHALADRYFVAADDVFAIGDEVETLSKRDPAAAYRVQEQFVKRLERNATHPDALAESYWRLGVLASKMGNPALAMTHYVRAVDLSPLSAKYLISAGFQAYDLHRDAVARGYFQRALAVDPGSADAYAGAGMTALRFGDRASAKMYAMRSRKYDPHSHALFTLEQLLRQ
jgi:tetratricopeptide (TPR) repeat protein